MREVACCGGMVVAFLFSGAEMSTAEKGNRPLGGVNVVGVVSVLYPCYI